MINIGIDGAGSSEGGELIRLLINHPDVELQQVCQPALSGRTVSDIHHGLLGERPLVFCNKLDIDDLDIVFSTSSADTDINDLCSDLSAGEDAKFHIALCSPDALVDSSEPFYLECDDVESDPDVEKTRWENALVYGIPELNRKPMVRGARRAVIPTAVESIIVVALAPIAENGALSSLVSVEVFMPEDLAAELTPRLESIEHRLSLLLSELGKKPTAIKINLKADSSTKRGIKMIASIESSVTAEDAKRLFLAEYDDHNMTHLCDKTLCYEEAEGTNSCLVRYEQTPDGAIGVEAIADARLRGGAGEAVHVMNLFAGLYEKTGLNLKASTF